MKRRFAKILRAFADRLDPRRFQREPARFHVAPAWTDAEAAVFANFLSTAAGRMFKERMSAMTAAVCIAGCQDGFHTTHSAGIGAGWHECLRKVLEHATISRVSRDPDTKDEPAPEGEEQLLERMSS